MAIWDTIAAPIIAIINKVVPDKAAAAVAISSLQAMEAAGQLEAEKTQLQAITSAQSDINKVEAGSSSVFVAGWRPFIGWVCGAALAWQVVSQALAWVAINFHLLPPPKLDVTDILAILPALLGMGYFRSMDKKNGVAT